MKNPPGFGGVRKLSGNRRNPYQARILTGYKESATARTALPIYQTIGYYPTRKDAMLALAKYNADPYELDNNKVTLAQIYELWFEKHSRDISYSAKKSYARTYSAYLEPLHKKPFKDIRPIDVESIILDDATPKSYKRLVKILFKMLDDYAVGNQVIPRSIYAGVDVKVSAEPKRVGKFISKDVIDEVKGINSLGSKYIILAVYTGLRITEVSMLPGHPERINLEEGYFKVGVKTEAGKGRIIPIHDEIKNLASELVTMDRTTEPTVREEMNKIFDKYEEKYVPHDLRHTFSTNAKRCKMDELARKLIMGHAIKDLTDRVYTHYQLEDLQKEMKKYRVT